MPRLRTVRRTPSSFASTGMANAWWMDEAMHRVITGVIAATTTWVLAGYGQGITKSEHEHEVGD